MTLEGKTVLLGVTGSIADDRECHEFYQSDHF